MTAPTVAGTGAGPVLRALRMRRAVGSRLASVVETSLSAVATAWGTSSV
nr:hypothetical protein [Streptomyces sp. S501]